MKFLLPFLFSFGISILLIPFLLWLGKKYNYKTAKRFGGLVVILVFALMILLKRDLVITKQISGIVFGGLLILLFGLWDDLKNLNWKYQLLFQIIIAVTAISFGVRSDFITNPFGGTIELKNTLIYFLFFIFYFLFFINSLNWLDGIDGLAGSVTLAALAVIFVLSLMPHVNQPAAAILCAAGGGTILAFLIFNWHPAKIIAGTAGAWFFGFLLASLSIFAGAKIATVLLATLIPVLDLLRVIWERYRAGQSVFAGNDGRHLQHKLLKLGLGERQIVFFVTAASVLIGAVALNVSAIGKMIFIVLFSISYFGLIGIIGATRS